MAYLAREEYRRPLTIFELVKHHVMIDVYMVLATGHQVIGGELKPWPFGPVVEEAYERLKGWEHRYEESHGEFQPAEYLLSDGELTAFEPRVAADPQEDFASAEIAAMSRASALLKSMTFDQAYHFFHSPATFMGRAYTTAREDRMAIAWPDVLDAHDAIHGTDHHLIKRRLISYG